jgi:hypothetical protein
VANPKLRPAKRLSRNFPKMDDCYVRVLKSLGLSGHCNGWRKRFYGATL